MGEGGKNEEPEPLEFPVEPCGQSYRVKAGSDGRLPLPPEVAVKLGLEPGAEVEIALKNGVAQIRPCIHSLARVYIEPTSRCNLECRTCIRNTWKETQGDMNASTFDRLMDGFRRLPHLKSVMFGGFGEPTMHPDIIRMVGDVKALGVKTELITNGTLLDGRMLSGFMDGRLDTLWVSFDGVSEAGFNDIRDGAGLDDILANLKNLKELNRRSSHRIAVGISFVVMKRNIAELRGIDRLIRRSGASFVSVTNVVPYSAEMEREMVCGAAMSFGTFSDSPGKAEICLPRLDVNNMTRDAILGLLAGNARLTLMGNPVSSGTSSCRFIKEGCMVVRWDGKISPCMGLLHPYKLYFRGGERAIEEYAAGDITRDDLLSIWTSTEYSRFREKVDAFDFAPCHACGGCSHSGSNRDDCSGTGFPACGGCLWAQGVIQCP
jgi:MoaA/NifB/PqqE/SkfB family radical SAM enzyme